MNLEEKHIQFVRTDDNLLAQTLYSENEYVYSSELTLVNHISTNYTELRISVTKDNLESLLESWDDDELSAFNKNISFTLSDEQIIKLIHSLKSLIK